MNLTMRTWIAFWLTVATVVAQDVAKTEWKYDAEAIVPFWTTDAMHGELLFPPRKILSVRNSNGDVEYEQDRDFVWEPGSRRITLPAGSRIVSKTPADLRRPA